MFSYKTNGVCATTINLEIVDNIIESVEFINGCAGNLLGIGQLVKGMTVDEVIEKLHGLKCKSKATSCPDQLSLALIEWKKQNNC